MELLEVIQQISQNTTNNAESIKIHFGVVTSADPLRIKIDSKFEIGMQFLILTNDVRDYETKISFPQLNPDSDGDTLTIKEEKATVKNALKKGENVVLLKFPNGKKYVVLTRV